MKWLESAGGPMVIMQAGSVAEWSGYRGSDYGLACSVDDAGIVDMVGGGSKFSVLSLWGEPLSTARSDELECVIQWRWAESEEDLLRVIRSSWNSLAWDTVGLVEWQSELRIFDASIPGEELASDESIDWSISNGRVSIMTAEIEVDSTACRLVKVGT